MKSHCYLVNFKDSNGKVLLAGTLDFPLLFKASRVKAATKLGFSKYRFEFYGVREVGGHAPEFVVVNL